MFMHNGFIGSWNRLRRKIENMIPDHLYPSRVGTTDSEAVFLAMMGAGLEQDPIGATLRVMRSLCDLVNENGLHERLRFTAALADGHDLYAFRFAENDTANTLYYRQSGDRLTVASEPLDADRTWTEVPANRVLISRPPRPLEIVPFLPKTHGEMQERKSLQRVVARA